MDLRSNKGMMQTSQSISNLFLMLINAKNEASSAEKLAFQKLPRDIVVEYHRLHIIAILSEETEDELKKSDFFRNEIVPLWLKYNETFCNEYIMALKY